MLKAPKNLTPPTAERRDHSFTHHGDTVADPYYWLKDPGYPDVTDEGILGYLKAENDYYKTVTKDDKPQIDALFEEIKGRMREDDEGVPYQHGKFDFRWAFTPGKQYRTWYYRPRTSDPFAGEAKDNEWDVLFDENVAAEGLEYFRLGTIAVSPDGRFMATSIDDNGSERFTVTVKNLESGDMLAETLSETSGELVWANDSQIFFYVKVSKEWRPYQVRGHILGTGADGSRDPIIYEESSSSFFVHIHETSSAEYLVIRAADHVTAENHILDLRNPNLIPKSTGSTPKNAGSTVIFDSKNLICASPRRENHDYSIDHAAIGFVIRSNKNHMNYGVFFAGDVREKSWLEQLSGNETRYIRGVQAFDFFTAVEDRIDGLDQITLLSPDGSACHVPMREAVYEVGLANNTEAGQAFIRLGFSSLLTPPTVLDVPVRLTSGKANPGEPEVRKVQEIPSGYDRSNYRSERLMVTARDGARVPVSLVYRADWQKNGNAPMHLYGYGAYGLGMSPSFSAPRLSLLDRGFIYAIAHVRGGDELGKGWYESGKLDARNNTFNDFVDVAKSLTEQGYAASGGISISGGSAGGELMGAVLNQAPGLFKGAVLHVPFVDVLNTMLDADLPLTPIEWPEWGNPIEDASAYQNIKGYCPYTNMEAKAYPPMFVTGGLNDPRVTYWEPAKWTAKMRSLKSDDNLLMMKINMGAGHGGKSGRFERFYEVAEEYMFLLNCFKVVSDNN